MSRYFIDCEFFERPGHIDLISIALVSDDRREFYAENESFNWDHPGVRNHTFLQEHVRPYLYNRKPVLKGPNQIKHDILYWLQEDKEPEFWGYFADYDWVCFCWLFGAMIDLPGHFPKFCLDIKQLMVERGVERKQLPAPFGVMHHALDDARWHREIYFHIINEEYKRFGRWET